MTPTVLTSLILAAGSSEAWMLGGGVALCSAAAGFAAGYCYSKLSAQRSLNRARHHASRLYAVVLETLDTAQKTCGLLDQFPNLMLTDEQTGGLEKKQNGLLTTLTRIVEQQNTVRSALETTPAPDVSGDPDEERSEFSVEWQRTSQDEPSGLPDRAAFATNFEALIDAGSESDVDSGLLLVRIDKFDALLQRYRRHNAEQFLRSLAAVVCRTVRDEELVCRYSRDTLAILMPAVDALTGGELAGTIRDRVRGYQFRLDETGPEVLVTASFGYTRLFPGDTAELALNRAGNALEKSLARGRNQLHIHDGTGLTHSMAG